MRARTRAIAVSAGGALVIAPLTGIAAVALATPSEEAPVTPDAAVVAELQANLAEGIADSSNVVVASGDADSLFDSAEVDVEADPEPVVTPTRRSTSSSSSSGASPVSNSSAVVAAISGSAVIAEAAKYVGYPYVSGGQSPADGGFDCSGFTSWVYGQLGISLPRSSGAYYGVGTRVSDPQPGDIIVSPGHVGIYAGPNLQIDSPRPGKTIQFRSIWQTNPVYVRVTG